MLKNGNEASNDVAVIQVLRQPQGLILPLYSLLSLVREFGSWSGLTKLVFVQSRCKVLVLVVSLRLLICNNHFKQILLKLMLRGGDLEQNPGPGLGRDGALRDDGNRQRQQQPNSQESHQPGSPVIDGSRQDSQVSGSCSAQGRGKCDLQVLSLNVRGLGDSKKVRHLINTCYKLSSAAVNSFYLLQETYVSKLDLLRYLWRGEAYLTAGNGNSQGCITLITAPYKIIHAVDLGLRGHVLALSKDDLNKVDVVIANVYAPNGFDIEKRRFFDELLDTIAEVKTAYNCCKIILGGDLNVVLNEDEVLNRAYSNGEKKLADDLKVLFNQMELSDGWQKVKTETKSYTWTSSRSGFPSFSTLDRVLYTGNKLILKKQVADWSVSVSDHAAVIVHFNESNIHTRANFVPRLDPRLLLDPEGTSVMDEVFAEMYGQRSITWNPHVSLEYCKMCIRTAANTAIGKIKARYRDEESSLNESINLIINELANGAAGMAHRELLMHKLDDLRQLKRCLVEKIGAKLERKTARKWYNEGELSSKYFFNLMSRKTNDEISVILKDGIELTEIKDIENEIRTFYKDLYEKVSTDLETNDDIFRNVDPVGQAEASTMEERLTIDDLEKTLMTCSDSAPGPDGIPYSFLKHFWKDVGPALVNAWNFSLDTNQLPPSHKISYLRLIPKADKDRRIIGNLRPITLSNTDHKLVTKTYAKRLTKVVADKIGPEQTAYIPGRLINDNVRAMLSTIDMANVDQSVDGALVSLDAKKAFDSVDHNYIRRCLTAFGLDGFIPIFNTLYKDLRSDIILNGRTVTGYQILVGVKQGDALSCILFIMCMEPLIRNLKQNITIEPIVTVGLPIRIPKVYSYADDVTVVAKRTDRGIQGIFTEYEAFTKNTGLVLNADKTEVLTFNRRRANHTWDITYLGEAHRLTSIDQVKVNGILLLQDPQLRETRNVAKVVATMERQLSAWSTRSLTLIGKILIIKTFAFSQLIYLMQTMSLNDFSFNLVNKVVYKYLWNKNFAATKAPDRLKRSIMLTPMQLGGFGMMDIKELGESLDLRSYGRLIVSEHPFFVQIKELIDSSDFFNVEVNGSVDRKVLKSLHLLNINRNKVLLWPIHNIVSNTALSSILLSRSMSKLITRQGRQSLHYFAIHRRVQNPKVKDVTLNEFMSIERFLLKAELGRIIRALITAHGGLDLRANDKDVYVSNAGTILNISMMSSRNLRLNQHAEEDKIICLYKIGLALDPGEVKAWTSKIRKLTSTRHKNIILRVAHGDIFSNSRLCKFGLRNSSNCSNCQETLETIQHRIAECPRAVETWRIANEAKQSLGLHVLTDYSIENLLGTKDRLSKLELAINAEILHKLTSRGEGYCSTQVVKASLKLISNSEKLTPELKRRFDEYLST